jgi:hypothetical protein
MDTVNIGLTLARSVSTTLDISDTLEVFLFTNLSTIVSPNPSVLLTPTFQTSLQAALNSVGEYHNIELADDLRQILDVFVITNINIISVNTTP